MVKYLFALLLSCSLLPVYSQNAKPVLTVEKIMRDPKWIGSSPSNIQWRYDGKELYFDWNPDQDDNDSLYAVSLATKTPQKMSSDQRQKLLTSNAIRYNLTRTAFTYVKNGDVFFVNKKNGRVQQLTKTVGQETNPRFSFGETRVVYTLNENLFSWDIATGETEQLTNFQTRKPADAGEQKLTEEEAWLRKDQLQYFQVLRERKQRKENVKKYRESENNEKELRSIPIAGKMMYNITISPDGRFISYNLFSRAANAKRTLVPVYVTESGYTQTIEGRTKVGSPQGAASAFIYDRVKDTVMEIKTDSVPGIRDIPEFVKQYPVQWEAAKKNPHPRPVRFSETVWSPQGTYGIVDIRSLDNKDRWLMLVKPESASLELIDHQHDEAWIGGPDIDASHIGWINETTCWFQSETTGYSHLYTADVVTKQKKALTQGSYEVQEAILSINKKYFYITTNEVHPGEQQFYRLTIADGKKERITSMTGANLVAISPDEKYIAFLYSYFNKPWELYLQENKAGSKAIQLTNKAQSDEFKTYPWRVPDLITFTARDGAQVYARLYKPENPAPNKPAVLFVHGAGYLQNAHKWWSLYFREYMFNNMLADNGYYVLDIDYRGSAGYGRDWRTAIYRHMGGKDLDDQVDGVNYLVQRFGVDPKHVGMYGGSYGGFMTLMAMFTTPDVFAAGAALRPVTNWANYNHGYTSDILNEPFNDSLAYRRSSPLYFADGLKGHLLICHGMMDVNVHFQDAIELTQRLIELGKDNWQIAPYPMEDHGFVEPSSWTDEYKRIFALFETVLKK
ncbi:MAG TPA: prolyl oligopeptidase family serine peptidase [Chitinophagaceae bacterium]|nr:prolyl oligopeptidase family serine peptidase [Chitinophagaceae bacterium]